jgi:hypothetical protein
MNIPVQNGQLPQGFCFTDFQTLLNAFSAQQFVSFSAISSIVASATPPADHTVAWLQLDALGAPVRLYFFARGAWLSRHPMVTGSIILWNQVLPDFTTFDGGDANAAPWSDLSGQMWQLAATLTNFPGGSGGSVQVLGGTKTSQVPLGVGTLPSGAAVAVGATGGEEVHQLTVGELAGHQHFIANTDVGTKSSPDISSNAALFTNYKQSQAGADTTDYVLRGTSTTPTVGPTSIIGNGGVQGNGLGHNTLPPYLGVYFLQRTSRLFYVVHP